MTIGKRRIVTLNALKAKAMKAEEAYKLAVENYNTAKDELDKDIAALESEIGKVEGVKDVGTKN